jgi:hypothetical protein
VFTVSVFSNHSQHDALTDEFAQCVNLLDQIIIYNDKTDKTSFVNDWPEARLELVN